MCCSPELTASNGGTIPRSASCRCRRHDSRSATVARRPTPPGEHASATWGDACNAGTAADLQAIAAIPADNLTAARITQKKHWPMSYGNGKSTGPAPAVIDYRGAGFKKLEGPERPKGDIPVSTKQPLAVLLDDLGKQFGRAHFLTVTMSRIPHPDQTPHPHPVARPSTRFSSSNAVRSPTWRRNTNCHP